MFKDKVLEVIRHLHLTRDNKKDVVDCYNRVSKVQKDDFESSIKCYEGRVNLSFEDSLYDKYVYALNARELLLLKFKFNKIKNDDVEKQPKIRFLHLVNIIEKM